MPKRLFSSSEKFPFYVETKNVSKFCILSLFLRVVSVAHFQKSPFYSFISFFFSPMSELLCFFSDSNYILFLSFSYTVFSYSFHCFLPYCWTISIWNVFVHVLVFSLKKDCHSNGSILLPVFVMHHLSLPFSTHPFPLRIFCLFLAIDLLFISSLAGPWSASAALLKKSSFPCSYLICHCLPFCVQDSLSPFSWKLLCYHHAVIKSISNFPH